jgi:hypothetical protein
LRSGGASRGCTAVHVHQHHVHVLLHVMCMCMYMSHVTCVVVVVDVVTGACFTTLHTGWGTYRRITARMWTRCLPLSGVWCGRLCAFYRLFLYFSFHHTTTRSTMHITSHVHVSCPATDHTRASQSVYPRCTCAPISLYLTCHDIQCHNSQSHPPSCAHIDTTDCVWLKPESTCLDTSLVTPMKDALPARGLSASHTHHARLKFPRLRHLHLPLAPAIPSRVPRGHVGRMPPPACRYRVR